MRAGVFFKLDSKAQHEMEPERDVDHMAMPGRPGTMLIMIHSELAFSFFKALLDGPAHHGGFAHFRERHIDRGIGEGEFSFSIRGASDKQPYGIFLRQSISGGINAEAGHLGEDRPLGALRQDNGVPMAFGRAGNLRDGFGLGLTGRKSRSFRFSAPPGVRRQLQLRFSKKNLSIGADIGEVVESFG